MPALTIGHCADPVSIAEVAAELASLHPGYSLGYGSCDGTPQWLGAGQGARVVWVQTGNGAVWLDTGYRTNEGDGLSLPPSYQPDAVEQADREALTILARAVPTSHPQTDMPTSHSQTTVAIRSIVERFTGQAYHGEMAGDLWRLITRGIGADEWASHTDAREAFDDLARRGQALGWSTKTGAGSFEAIGAGDQLLIRPAERVRVQGTFAYWWMEMPPGVTPPGSTTRRLRYLKDTAGGCAPGFDAFRRLTLTWQFFTDTPDRPDGANVLNSHVVNIAAEQSRTHYHPNPPVNGGMAQTEFYFVLDPADLALQQAARLSMLHAFPDITDWSQVHQVHLRPGAVALIPPNTVHRGLDVLVNVVTIPGFKPHNEIYIDALIAQQTAGRGVYNRASVPVEVTAQPQTEPQGIAPLAIGAHVRCA